MSSVHNLPIELISKILQKLPAKVITQLKSICKLWYNIVSNRDFARSHLVSNREEQVIIIERLGIEPFSLSYSFIKLEQEIKDIQAEKQFKRYCMVRDFLKDQGEDIWFIASSDGLVLLQSKRDINQLYVCNPLTLHCTKLPRLNILFGQPTYLALVLDETLGQITYKVVAICDSSLQCFVIKPGKTMWKELNTGYRNSFILSTHSLTLVNKEYHWLRYVGYEPYLFSMNARTEEIRFRETKISSNITCKFNHNSILELKGSLSLTDSTSNFNQLIIWSLNEYNSQWTKTFTISLDSEVYNPNRVYSFPCSYLRQTVILIQYKNLLLFYDLEEKDSKKVILPLKDCSQYDLQKLVHQNLSCQCHLCIGY